MDSAWCQIPVPALPAEGCLSCHRYLMDEDVMGVMLCVTRAPKGQNAKFLVCLSWVTALFCNSEVLGLSTLLQDICRPLRKCFEENLGLKIVSRAVLCLQPSYTYLEMCFQIFACLLQTRYFIPDKYRNGRILTQNFLVAMKWCFVIKKTQKSKKKKITNSLLCVSYTVMHFLWMGTDLVLVP